MAAKDTSTGAVRNDAGGGPDGLVLDPAVRAFLDRRAGDPHPLALSADVGAARRAFARLQAGVVTAAPGPVEDKVLPVGPTGAVGVRIFRPPEDDGLFPAVLYLHGGCWIVGGTGTHDRLMRELAEGARAAIVFVDYALAPEAGFPVQNEQAYAVLEYMAGNARSLRLDGARIAVAGDCSGGSMAAAVALLAKRRRGPEIALQLLFCPVLAEPPAGSRDGPWFAPGMVRRGLAALFQDGALRRNDAAFPLSASLVQLNDLPEALVIVAEHDPVRDDGEAYARRLIEAGVIATCTRYNGTIHDFVVLNALAQGATARNAISQATSALRASFSKP